MDPDNITIDMEMMPKVVELKGYETRFNTPIIVGGIAIDNKYDMPILTTRSVESKVKIWDGETIVLGGLIRENVITVDDKIPFLADIPVVGRLFRNKGESRQKSNLLIFVTARLVNYAGLPLRESKVQGLPDFKRL